MLSFYLIIIVFLALAFDFINGFHDTANAVATSISTKALTPRAAIIMAASLNFIGAVSGTAVAKTIGKGIIDPGIVDHHLLIAALLGAIIWNLFTWYYGIPSSSSHALIGGLVGAAIVSNGFGSLNFGGLKVIIASLLITPVLAFVVGYIVMTIFFLCFHNFKPVKLNMVFKKLQIFSAAAAAFSHGSNDAQKSMGIVAMALFSAGLIDTFHVPLWVMSACAIAMAMGTATGGARIIHTMGSKIFRIEPINGFAADISSAIVIYTSTLLGHPVSTTHVVSSSILGVGAAKRFRQVKWTTAQQMLMAWIFTIPCTAFVAGLINLIFTLFLG